MDILLELLIDWWRQENSSKYGEEVEGIQDGFGFGDFWTNLGEIIVVEG